MCVLAERRTYSYVCVQLVKSWFQAKFLDKLYETAGALLIERFP